MDARSLFRDARCSMAPNGRPAKKPRNIAKSLLAEKQMNVGPCQYILLLNKPKPSHCISLQECMETRPPLHTSRIQTPSPCTYNICNSTLSSKSSLCWIPSNKVNPAPSLSKGNVWIYETASRNCKTPNPCTYTLPQLLGHQCNYKRTSPSFTMRLKTSYQNSRYGADKEPGPNSYNIMESAKHIFSSPPSLSIKRPSSTAKRPVTTPGPAHYFQPYT